MKHHEQAVGQIFSLPGFETAYKPQGTAALLVTVTDIVQHDRCTRGKSAHSLFELAWLLLIDSINVETIEIVAAVPGPITNKKARLDSMRVAQFAREQIGIIAHAAERRREMRNDLKKLQ